MTSITVAGDVPWKTAAVLRWLSRREDRLSGPPKNFLNLKNFVVYHDP